MLAKPLSHNVFVKNGFQPLIQECFQKGMLTVTGTKSYIGMIQGLEQSLASIAHAAVAQIIKSLLTRFFVDQMEVTEQEA